MNNTWFILLGLLGGVYGGLFGLGAGSLLVPVLIYFFHFTQHQAQGTVLTMYVVPIGLLAALRYYYSGHVKLSVAAFLAIGFLLGGFVGAHLAQRIPDMLLRRSFGFVIFLVSLKMMMGK